MASAIRLSKTDSVRNCLISKDLLEPTAFLNPISRALVADLADQHLGGVHRRDRRLGGGLEDHLLDQHRAGIGVDVEGRHPALRAGLLIAAGIRRCVIALEDPDLGIKGISAFMVGMTFGALGARNVRRQTVKA